MHLLDFRPAFHKLNGKLTGSEAIKHLLALRPHYLIQQLDSLLPWHLCIFSLTLQISVSSHSNGNIWVDMAASAISDQHYFHNE
jgi:hypothetical protein